MEKKEMSEIVSVCPICGGDVVVREVEKMVKGGNNVAIIRVKAGVCSKCGERIYSKETHEKIQRIRRELKEGVTKNFEAIGCTYIYKAEV